MKNSHPSRIPHALRAGLIADVYLEMAGHTMELYEIRLDPADGDDEMLDQALTVARRTRQPADCDHDWTALAHVIARPRGYSAPLGSWVESQRSAAALVCVQCPRPAETAA